jgi:TonB-dependent starch-binding outer membrane protein SusC
MKKKYRLSRRLGKNVNLRKIWMAMKLTTLLLILTITQILASESYSQATRLSLQLKEVSLKEVLNQIEQESDFFFLYNSKLVDVNRIVNVDAKNQRIDDLLNQLFPEKDVSFIVIDKQIIISPKTSETSFPKQQVRVTGVVLDSMNGDPIIGANIVIEGTTTGVTSDVNGRFSLDLPKSETVILVSFLGYNKERITVKGESNLEIRLVPDITRLEEIIVVGYGSVKKSDLTGSVSSINSKDFGDRQISDIGSLIQGKATGVDVSQGKIRIRGVTTFNNTDPLIVIDGFLGGNLESVSANDIESIEVLKDASSTAIYGSRGANGVILITTKSGKSGAMKVNLNAYSGFSYTPKKLDMLNANQYVDYVLDALENSNQTPSAKLLSPEVRIDAPTKIQDELFRVAHKSEVTLDFSGGSDKATYFFSLGYRHNEGIVIGQKRDYFSLRNKNDFKIRSWLRGGNNIALSYDINKDSEAWAFGFGFPPYYSVRDTSNSWGYTNVNRITDLTDIYNPVPQIVLYHPEQHNLNYQANLWAEIEPVKGLVYRIQGGTTGVFSHFSTWNESYINGGAQYYDNAASQSSSYGFYPLLESYLTYSHKFGKHDVSAMVGNTVQNYAQGGQIAAEGTRYADPSIRNIKLGDSYTLSSSTGSWYAYISYFGRFNYQFNNKYLLTVNIRRDASPRFAPQNRWATFPSIALAWKLSEEKFIKDLNIFDLLKLRVGWGISGNDAIGDFRYVSNVWASDIVYPLGSSQSPQRGATVRDNSSGSIKWESTESKSIGADMAFYQNKLNITVDYFIKNSNDILFPVPRPASLGYGGNDGGDAIVNAASCENKGFEIQAGFRNTIGALNYSVNANYTYSKNNVTSLGLGQPFLSGVSRTDIGNPIGYFYGFVADGIFMTQAELDEANAYAQSKGSAYFQSDITKPGDVRFKDLNSDGHIDYDHDRTNLGSPIPVHNYGLSILLDYKGFDFNVNLQGIAGSSIYNGAYNWYWAGTSMQNQTTYVLDRWRSEDEPGNGLVPRAVNGDPSQNNRPSSLMVSSGNYMKVRQISLGYSIPFALASKIGIEKLRIYTTAYNFFTISKYVGFDPEVGGENLIRGIDSFGIPNPKSLVFGIQLGF